ncbi:hypothetical protein BJ165DRAFT_1405047 [Panaeolus papilionaceus]|nr:hypothetical protein BJ165DRAFT_1405047 [Panaeolus papilionaceus]
MSSDFKASVIFDGNNELSLTCGKDSESEVDTDTESDCGCDENQLAHYEIDGTVRTDLRERCLRRVNGPIGGAESESVPGDYSTNDESDTEPETIENNSISIGVSSERNTTPPANQLQEANLVKTAVKQVKKRPPPRKQVTHWNIRVEAARKSSNKRNKGTRRDSGSVEGGNFQTLDQSQCFGEQS